MKLHTQYLLFLLSTYMVILISIPGTIWLITGFPLFDILWEVMSFLWVPFVISLMIWPMLAWDNGYDLHS